MINENRFNLIFSFITIFILFISSFVFAESNGTTTANFLKAEVGARATAATFMYNQAFRGSNYGFLAYGLNLRDKGSLGVSLIYIRSITSNTSMENNLKFIRGSIEEEKALGFALDFGILTRVNNNLSFGLSLLNLGTKMKYIDKGDNLSLDIKVGTSLRLLNDKLLLSLDISKPIDSDINIKTGAEYRLFNSLAIRVGYASGSQDIGSGLSLGFGLGGTLFDLDLNYVPYGNLGYMLRVNVSYSLSSTPNYSSSNEYKDGYESE